MARSLFFSLIAAFIWRLSRLTPLMYMFCETLGGHTSQAIFQKGKASS